jgi:PAS domain S-box-containing protein
MKKLLHTVSRYRKSDPALAVTLQFVLFGIIWILFSDSLLFVLGPDSVIARLAHIHILKGLFFIGVAAAFLFYWMNDYCLQLNQRESDVRNVFRSSPLPMGVVDASTFRFLEVNDALVKMFGYSAAEFDKLTLEDLAADKQMYESLPLMIKTGVKELGTWKHVTRTKEVFSVEFCVQPIRERTAWLLMFVNVTHEVRTRNELKGMKEAVETQLSRRIDHLTRVNEELAYRASQTEHVNTELIAVNERLQLVNKKVAMQADDLSWKYSVLSGIMASMDDAAWSFDLTGKNKNYITPSTQKIFEEDSLENLSKPWFWLDYVHPDDEALKELSQHRLLDIGETSCACRILTAKGNTLLLYWRLKIVRDLKGTLTLIGSASRLSQITQEKKEAEVTEDDTSASN